MAPKRKPTKAELERKKREEEEKKRQEEEEARLKAEQEEKERIRKEKELAEQLRVQEKEELKKRVGELEEYRSISGGIRENLNFYDNERRKKYEWDRYMICDGSPDPSLPREINTYMNLWRENEERSDMDNVINDSILCLRLIHELEYLIADTPSDGENEKKIKNYKNTITELQELLQHKMDIATVETLSQASLIADPETMNLQRTWRSDHIRLCLWGNLSKNPRIHSYEFSEEGITFDIPKPLTLSDCAFRILFTKYDHYSPLCKSFEARRVIAEPAVVEEIPEAAEKSEETVEPDNAATDAPEIDVLAQLQGMETGEVEQVVAPEPEEEVNLPEEDVAKSPEPPQWDEVEAEEDAIDLRTQLPLGGLFRLDLLNLPPQPKSARGWMMAQRVVPPVLKPHDYRPDPINAVGGPSSEADATQASSQPDTGAAADAGDVSFPASAGGPGNKQPEEKEKEERPPIVVTFKLPRSIVFCDTAVVAHWDQETKQWRTSGISVDQYSEEKREVVFRTSVFGSMGLFQDVHVNMPFQCWEMRPFSGGLELALSHLREAALGGAGVGASGTAPDAASANSATASQVPVGTGLAAGGGPAQVGQGQQPPQASQQINSEEANAPVVSVSDRGLVLDCALGPVLTPGSYIEAEVYSPGVDPSINQCLITIIAAIHEVKLHVCGERVSVLYDQEKTELNHLAGKWFTVRDLIRVLRETGINLFPQPDSSKYVSVATKSSLVEQRLYEQMALLSPSVAFSWSRWNSQCNDKEKIILLATEHMEPTRAIDEEAWRVYTCTRKKVVRLNMKEYDTQFKDEVDDSVGFHAEFYHMYQQIACEEGRDRIRKIDSKYVRTVQQLLEATRVATYS